VVGAQHGVAGADDLAAAVAVCDGGRACPIQRARAREKDLER